MNWKERPPATHAAAFFAGAVAVATIGIPLHNMVVETKEATIEGLEKELARTEMVRDAPFGSVVDVVKVEGELPGKGFPDTQHSLAYRPNNPIQIEVEDPLDTFLVNFRYDAIGKKSGHASKSGYSYGVIIQVQDRNGNEVKRYVADNGEYRHGSDEPWRYTAAGSVTILGLDPGSYRIAVLDHANVTRSWKGFRMAVFMMPRA